MALCFCLNVILLPQFFWDGARSLFVLALTILKRNEGYLLSCSDDGEAMMKLQEYFAEILLDDDGSMLETETSVTSPNCETPPPRSPPVSISRLLRDAFDSYSHITRESIDKKRLNNRLQVVQNIEDAAQKNVLRAVHGHSTLNQEELKSLYLVVKNDQLARTNQVYLDPTEKHDPTVAYYELYKADFDTFYKLVCQMIKTVHYVYFIMLLQSIFKILSVQGHLSLGTGRGDRFDTLRETLQADG